MTNDNVELTEAEQELLKQMEENGLSLVDDGEREPQHSLLRIWSEVLSNIETVRDQPIPIGVAGHVVAAWPKLSFQDTERYHSYYHQWLLDCRSFLEKKIEEHPEAVERMEDTDAKENAGLYFELIVEWNVFLDSLEMQWRAEHPESHIQYAALVDVRRMLFSRDGFAGHLEARKVKVDQDAVAEAIALAREEQGE